ncbi:hypothetical protein BDZ89DRAFT_1135042 [Hymenopellis radicata]|nr:hypothetical protein BDZ89DRAFT_1135042 [Hymenopellis radicata]
MLASVVSPSSDDSSNDATSIDPASTESVSVDGTDEDSDDPSESSGSLLLLHPLTPDEDSIVEVVRITAFRRATWDLKDPVIGIALSEKGFSARTYFAWADQNPHGSAMVHGVTSSDCQTSLGAFDLSAPDSVLLLASFLLSLRPLYLAFAQQCHGALYSDVKSWRADSHSDDLKRIPESCEDKISTWLHHLQSNLTAFRRKGSKSEINPYSVNATEPDMIKLPPELPTHLQYKKANQTSTKAVRQLKLYLVSAVVSLASLGFKKQPCTDWRRMELSELFSAVGIRFSKKSDTIFIMDRNIHSIFLRPSRSLEQLVRDHVGTPDDVQDKWTKYTQDEELFPDRKKRTQTKKKEKPARKETTS